MGRFRQAATPRSAMVRYAIEMATGRRIERRIIAALL
jgi:hypothetical protein